MTDAGPLVVELWCWRLDASQDERRRLARWLSPDEGERARRFHFDRDRERFVVAHGRLREILAGRLDVAPDARRVAAGEHGKPTLDGPDRGPHFNLSHSHDLAALAVCAETELGCDVEAERPLKEDIAGRFFSPREVAALRALPAAEQRAAFYRCWTRKEAVLKALGSGLARPLDSFDVTLAPGDVRLERMDGEPEAPRTWALLAFEPAPDFAGAVALRAVGRPVALRHRTH